MSWTEAANALRGTRVPSRTQLTRIPAETLLLRVDRYTEVELAITKQKLDRAYDAMANSSEYDEMEEQALREAYALHVAWLDCIEDCISIAQVGMTERDLSPQFDAVKALRMEYQQPVTALLNRRKEQARRGREAQSEANKAQDELRKLLRPAELTTEFSLAEYVEWKKKFEAYYQATGMRYHTDQAQKQLFVSFLSRDLQVQIRDKIAHNPPINGGGPNSVLFILDRIFDTLNPTFKNVSDFFAIRQRGDEDVEVLLGRIKAAAEQANKDRLTTVSPWHIEPASEST